MGWTIQIVGNVGLIFKIIIFVKVGVGVEVMGRLSVGFGLAYL